MRHSISRLAALAAALVMAFAVTAVSTPAYAAGELQLSADDGVTWTAAGAPLEFGNPVWVPGDTDRATMLVRNASGQPAQVHARVLIEDRLPTDVTMTAALGGGAGQVIEHSGDLTNEITLAPNQTAQATLDVVVGDNAVMREAATIQLVFRASGAGDLPGPDPSPGPDETRPGTGADAGADTGAGAADTENDAGTDAADRTGEVEGDGLPGATGELADAGAPDIGWLVLLGSLLAGTGLALIARRRRDKNQEEVTS